MITLYTRLDRIEDIKKATNFAQPDHIPVITMWTTWPTAVSGAKTMPLYDDAQAAIGVWDNALSKVYCDCTLNMGLAGVIPVLNILGSTGYFISEDGVTLQHKENCKMTEDDYPLLIADPMDFMVNTLSKRKFCNLKGDENALYALLKEAAVKLNRIGDISGQIARFGEEKYGIVNLQKGTRAHPPLDVLFDRVRGFNNTLVDIRRRPQAVIDATQALFPIYSDFLKKGLAKMTNDFFFVNTMVHSPTFLGPQKFEKFFWPTYKPLLDSIAKANQKIAMFLEGDWTPLYEYFRELPKGLVVGVLEGGDIIDAKKKIGDYITLVGGVKTDMLRYLSRSECLSEADKIIQQCAGGGGFIFGTERVLLTENDVNIDNMAAVNEFVHSYKM